MMDVDSRTLEVRTGQRLNGYRGAIAPLMVVAIVGIIALIGIVLTYTRQSADQRQAQNLADASALAAANVLDGTLEGWLKSKQAALATLKRSKSIYGFRGPLDSVNGDIEWQGLAFNDPTGLVDDYLDDFPAYDRYHFNRGVHGKLRITIERGTYWESEVEDSDELKMEFVSLEQDSESRSYRVYDAPAYVVANAVRVKIEIADDSVDFGAAQGITERAVTQTTSVAAYNRAMEQCVLPIAVPLCQLMRDMDYRTKHGTMSERYFAGDQCQREMLAFEADVENSDFRLEGLTRALSYPAPIMTHMDGTLPNRCYPSITTPGRRPNCKGATIYATMGIPESATQSDLRGVAATPEEVAKVMLNNPKGCINARIGTKFRAMDHGVADSGDPFVRDGAPTTEGGFLQPGPGRPLEQRLLNLMNSSGVTFRDTFFDEAGRPKANFPFNRKGDQQKMLYWPFPGGLGEAQLHEKGKLVRRDAPGGINWVNPACHTEGTGTHTLPVKIMVIVPTNDENTSYCSSSPYLTAYPRASIPHSGTEPRVVGFVSANVFDFHLQKHEDGELIGYTDEDIRRRKPVIGSQLRFMWPKDKLDHDNNVKCINLPSGDGDYSKKLNNLYESFKGHQTERSRWKQCLDVERPKCLNACDSKYGDDDDDSGSGKGKKGKGNSGALNRCKRGCPSCEKPAKPNMSQPRFFELVESFLSEDCFVGPSMCYAKLPPGFHRYNDDSNADEYDSVMAKFVNCLKQFNGTECDGIAKFGRTCMPYKERGANPKNPASWAIRQLQPQYLCGGLRMRLNCEDKNILGAFGDSDVDPSPVIVD